MYIPLIAWALLLLMPLYFMISLSFTEAVAFLRMPPQLIPVPGTLSNYRHVLGAYGVPRWFLNSAVVTTANTSISLLVSSFYGYIFAKKRFPGQTTLFWLLISTMMVPGQITLIPVFLMFRGFGLLNSYWALIVPGLFSAFGVFLMRQVMKPLPSELIDAARIDGCGELGIYWRIMVPLAKPGLAVLGIFTFVGSWNDFFWPLVVLSKPLMYTLPVGLPTLQQRYMDYGLAMAGATLAALPTITVFLAFQRYFLQGITVGALKG
ncbi:MAG: carbohydrate ABC transporter permease [Anaerolineae bacterium]